MAAIKHTRRYLVLAATLTIIVVAGREGMKPFTGSQAPSVMPGLVPEIHAVQLIVS
jgi:hypothetical protein